MGGKNATSALIPVSEAKNDEVKARVPWYVIVAWSIFTVAHVTYQVIHLPPDLMARFAG